MRQKFDLALIPPAPDLSFEEQLWELGIRSVAGIDEAGRGALAGPVAAAALVFDPDLSLPSRLSGVRDSKEMTPSAREYWAGRLKEIALAWGVGFASCEEIDALGIVPATRLAVRRALEQLVVQPKHLLVDYLDLPDVALPQTSLVKGDARSLSIAAASVLAKTSRDSLCLTLDAQFPGYDIARHKGYGTSAHLAALKRLGASPAHRRSFKPIYQGEEP